MLPQPKHSGIFVAIYRCYGMHSSQSFAFLSCTALTSNPPNVGCNLGIRSNKASCCQLRLFWLLGYLTYLDLCRVSLARLSAHVLALHAAGQSSDRFRSHQRVHYLLSEMCFEVSDTARDQCLLHIWCLLTYIGESVRSTTNNDTIVYLRQHELTQLSLIHI